MATAEILLRLAEARGLVLTSEEAAAVLGPVLELIHEAERLTGAESYGAARPEFSGDEEREDG